MFSIVGQGAVCPYMYIRIVGNFCIRYTGIVGNITHIHIKSRLDSQYCAHKYTQLYDIIFKSESVNKDFWRCFWLCCQLISSGQNGAILQSTFSNAFSSMKNCSSFFFQISLTFVPMAPFDIKLASIGSGNCLAPNKRQAITWTNTDQILWRINAALLRDELINRKLVVRIIDELLMLRFIVWY